MTASFICLFDSSAVKRCKTSTYHIICEISIKSASIIQMLFPECITWYLIPKAPIISYGMDMHRENIIIPESMGYVSGCICIFICILYGVYTYNMALSVLLGLVDDIFVLRWRDKLLLRDMPVSNRMALMVVARGIMLHALL